MVLAEFAAALDNAVAQDEKLAECVQVNPASVRNAILTAAMLGLRPGPVHKHFALTCFKVRGTPTCVGIPEWRGLIEVANQAGQLDTSIVAGVIYACDVKEELFDYDRFTGKLKLPKDDFLGEYEAKRTADNLVAAYATCRVKDRKGWATTVLDKKAIEKRRECSAAWRFQKGASIWGTDPVAMWTKSAVRALLESGKVPMSQNIMATMTTAERIAESVEEEVIRTVEVIGQEIAAEQFPEDVIDEKEPTGKVGNAPEVKVVDSDKPPEDTTVIWRNSRTLKTYRHDGGNWTPVVG